MSDHFTALLNQRAEIAAALNLHPSAIEQALERRRREGNGFEAPHTCIYTTQRGTACMRDAAMQISHFTWACREHHRHLISDLANIIEHQTSNQDLTDITAAIWRRVNRDDWSRHCFHRDLITHHDEIMKARLHRKWGAAS